MASHRKAPSFCLSGGQLPVKTIHSIPLPPVLKLIRSQTTSIPSFRSWRRRMLTVPFARQSICNAMVIGSKILHLWILRALYIIENNMKLDHRTLVFNHNFLSSVSTTIELKLTMHKPSKQASKQTPRKRVADDAVVCSPLYEKA
ncbi:unnamed protein product (mitochondrion) [Musa textilis]